MSSNFGAGNSAAEAAAAFASEIRGSNVIITGASPHSLGAECARVLALEGAGLIVLAGRNRANLVETAASIKKETSGANLRLLDLDLQSLDSVRKAAAEVLAYPESIDVLYNNAAIMAVPFALLPGSGLESQFGTNRIGHFLFTNLILPKLSSSSRIINVSSNGHGLSPVRFDDITFGNGKEYLAWPAYGQSKTANILFSRELAKRLEGKGTLAFSLHPGGIMTNLMRDVSMEDKKYIGFFDEKGDVDTSKIVLKTLEAGYFDVGSFAAHIVAGFSPSIVEHNGAYLDDCQIAEERCQEWAKDMGNAARLWALSEKIVGQKFL